MTDFHTKKTSEYESDVVELFEFSLGTTTHKYTSYPGGYIHQGVEYKHHNLGRGGDRDGANLEKMELPVYCDPDFVPIQRYFHSPPSAHMTLTLYEVERSVAEKLQRRFATLSGFTKEEGRVTMVFEPHSTSLRRTGLSQTFSPLCVNRLYEEDVLGCGVIKANFAVPATVESFTDYSLVTNALEGVEDHVYGGGLLEYEAEDGILESRTIISQVGTKISVSMRLYGLDATTPITIYRGCDRLRETCEKEFKAIEFFQGHDTSPDTGPFDGQPIF